MTQQTPDLSDRDRDRLLDALFDEASAAPAGGIARSAGPGAAPASYAQRRLWFVDRFDPGNPAYNVPLAVRIRGALDSAALSEALDRVVARHDVLRTRFQEADGGPVPVVAPPAPVPLPVAEADEAGPAAADWISAECLRVFDLAEGPLLRAAVLRESADSHVLLLVAHHSVVDGWSLAVVLDELSRYYAESTAGRAAAEPGTAAPTPDAEPPVQHADFAVWQRDRVVGGAFAADLDYWRAALDGAPPVLTLPQDAPAPGAARYTGAVARARVDASTFARLRSLGAAAGSSPFMVVLTAFQLLLGRLSGTSDVVVGVPTAGRSRPELAGAVGCFLNTLALRADLSAQSPEQAAAGGPSFRELLARVNRTALAGYNHQEVPFEHIVEALRPERSAAHAPIFQVLYNHNDTGRGTDRLGDLPLEPLDPAAPPAKLPLTLYSRETHGPDGTRGLDGTHGLNGTHGPDGTGDPQSGGELVLEAVFQTALYRPERIDHLLGQLVRLLDQAVADPDAPVARHRLDPPGAALPDPAASPGTALPDPAAPLPAEARPTVRRLLQDRVAADPTAPAVECGRVRWTYAELWERAEAIRTALGLDPAAARRPVVAVSGHRGPALVAALVAVLAGGGVLAAIDPRLPRLRQQAVLSAAGARLAVLAAGPAGPDGPDGADQAESPLRRDGITVVDVSADGRPGWPGGGDDGNIGVAVEAAFDVASEVGRGHPSETGYLCFTSGTTGQPKGVLGREAGLAHFLLWQRAAFEVGPGDRTGFLTGLSFDVMLRDLLLPLVSGATLCIPEQGDELMPGDLLAWLAEQRITAVHTVPALAAAWLAERPADGPVPDRLRLAFFAGEPLAGALVERWRAACPACTAVNLYGPTETTLAVCSWTVPAAPAGGVQPVGRPLPGIQALVLDPDLAGCGVGEVGET